MAVSAVYTLLLLPALPIAFIAIIALGIGLLPFAPLFTLVFAARWTGAEEFRPPLTLSKKSFGAAT